MSVGVLVGVSVGVGVGVSVGVFVGCRSESVSAYSSGCVEWSAFRRVFVGVSVGVLVGVFVAVFGRATGVWVGVLVAVAHGIAVRFRRHRRRTRVGRVDRSCSRRTRTRRQRRRRHLPALRLLPHPEAKIGPSPGCSPKWWTASRRFRARPGRGVMRHFALDRLRIAAVGNSSGLSSESGDPCATLLYDRRVHVCSGAVRA